MPLDPMRFRDWSRYSDQTKTNTPKRSARATWIWMSVFGLIVVGIVVVILLTPAPSK